MSITVVNEIARLREIVKTYKKEGKTIALDGKSSQRS